jgi:hypothetical protein
VKFTAIQHREPMLKNIAPMLVIKDWRYYVDHQMEIEDWTNKYTPGWLLTGLILTFKNEADRLAFLLRWE